MILPLLTTKTEDVLARIRSPLSQYGRSIRTVADQSASTTTLPPSQVVRVMLNCWFASTWRLWSAPARTEESDRLEPSGARRCGASTSSNESAR